MSLSKDFYELFSGLQRAYGSFKIDSTKTGTKKKGKATTIKGKITEELWQQHLGGKAGIGVVPITDDDVCSWGAIDIDEYDLDLVKLEEKIAALELPLVLCRTKSGGAHLYLFLHTPAPAELLQNRLTKCASALGYSGCEIFPKQTHLSGPTDCGNWINMPYFDSSATSRYAISNGSPITAEEFIQLAKDYTITQKELELLNPSPATEYFGDGPPCLEHLAKVGFPEGSRNNALFNCGVYYRKKYDDGWEDYVSDANQRWMGPGTFQEVMGIIKSLGKKGYKYKCSDQPVAMHCQKGICSKRPFGIPDAKTFKAEEKKKRACVLEHVDKPIKCYQPPEGSNDEPHWEFKIHGKKLSLTSEHIRSQAKFLAEYFKHFHRLALPVDEQRWADILNELLAEEEIAEMPVDAGPEGQLWAHLEAFCTLKAQGKDKQELAMGRPWTNEGRTYFRSSDLMKYLDQQHFKAFKENQIWPILRRRDLDHHQFMIKGRCIQCWSVGAFKTQDEPFSVPEIIKEIDEPW